MIKKLCVILPVITFFALSRPIIVKAACGSLAKSSNGTASCINMQTASKIYPFLDCKIASTGGDYIINVCCSTSTECDNFRSDTQVDLFHDSPQKSVSELGIKYHWVDFHLATGARSFLLSAGQPDFIPQLLTKLLPYALIFAGLLLLLMLIAGGFTMLSNPTNPQAQDAGKKRITWAIAGFILLFAAYWIMQILEIVFGIRVVS